MIEKEIDIVIIGSGAGGGTVAEKLAPLVNQGLSIAVLEAGPHFPTNYLTQREVEMLDLFHSGGAWPTANGALTMSIGEAMGGSTLMYTGVTFRIPDNVLEDWNVPNLTSQDLNPRFDKIEKEINVIIPDESMTNDNNRLFKKGCDNLGISVNKIPLNVKNCEQMGFCNLGCAKGNKQGTINVQIPRAKQLGVQFIPNCKVNKIAGHNVLASVGKAPKDTINGPWETGNYTIKAKRIVIAGGTKGSTEILLRSEFDKTLPNIGKYITLHPALVVNAIYPEKIKNYEGFPKVYYSPQFSDSHHYYLETAFYYPFITTKNTCLWGPDLKHVMYHYDHLMTMLILMHDDALLTNQIVLDKSGNAVMQYEMSDKVIETMIHAQIKSTEVFFAAGCEEVIMPCADKILFSKKDLAGKSLDSFITKKNYLPNKIPLASAHLQGGCKMGTDASDSVVNTYGQLHGHDHIYVADGSIFPKSSHVNPYLTIMALADRIGERIINSL